MNVKVLNEREVLQEAFDVLAGHMPMSKVLRFWAACQLGEGDYLTFREQQFAGETVDSLYDKIKAFEDTER